MTTNGDQKQGCLSLFLPFLGRKSRPVTEAFPYRLRDDFLSPAELSFYKVLSPVLGSRFTIQSKVRLADIFFVLRRNENIAYFNKISQRHVDFLVCDSTTMKPLLGIELDDASHQRHSRRERDEFVERVFQAARLPLLRFPVQRQYNARDIAGQVVPFLREKAARSASSQPAPASPSGPVPLCPKCGIPMILRTVKQGRYKGRQFYGCQNYPRCREVKPVPIQEAA